MYQLGQIFFCHPRQNNASPQKETRDSLDLNAKDQPRSEVYDYAQRLLKDGSLEQVLQQTRQFEAQLNVHENHNHQPSHHNHDGFSPEKAAGTSEERRYSEYLENIRELQNDQSGHNIYTHEIDPPGAAPRPHENSGNAGYKGLDEETEEIEFSDHFTTEHDNNLNNSTLV